MGNSTECIRGIGDLIFLNFNIKNLEPIHSFHLDEYLTIFEFYANKDTLDYNFKAHGEDTIDTCCGVYKTNLRTQMEIYLYFNEYDNIDNKICVSVMIKKR